MKRKALLSNPRLFPRGGLAFMDMKSYIDDLPLSRPCRVQI